MANLKDLRNRIASVKATQKITKAMQMVAAAKLRKAQEAAEAARPYASRMGSVLANLSAAMEGREGGSALMAGTGKQDTHLLIVCTAERGLCGGFNSNIAKLARDHADRLIRDGKSVKIICVGKKGYDVLRRKYDHLIVDRVDLREVKRVAFGNAHEIAIKILSMFDDGEYDVATLFYSEFQSVMTQIPTALQIIPANVTASAGDVDETVDLAVRFTITSRTKVKFWRNCCPVILACRFSGPCLKMQRPNKVLACPRWTTRPAMQVR